MTAKTEDKKTNSNIINFNNFRKKNIGARMLLSYERVQRVNKDTPSHTIINFTQLWDFRTDF